MGAMTCKVCGGSSFVTDGEYLICQICGYTLEISKGTPRSGGANASPAPNGGHVETIHRFDAVGKSLDQSIDTPVPAVRSAIGESRVPTRAGNAVAPSSGAGSAPSSVEEQIAAMRAFLFEAKEGAQPSREVGGGIIAQGTATPSGNVSSGDQTGSRTPAQGGARSSRAQSGASSSPAVGGAERGQADAPVSWSLRFDRGYISPRFAAESETMTVELHNPYILVTDQKFSSELGMLLVLDSILSSGRPYRPLLIIAGDVEGKALDTLLKDNAYWGMPVCAVRAPGYGDRRKRLVEDIAIATGSRAIMSERGIHVYDFTADMLGSAKLARVSRDDTTILGGAGSKDAIRQRIAQIEAEMRDTPSDFDRERLMERLEMLSGCL